MVLAALLLTRLPAAVAVVPSRCWYAALLAVALALAAAAAALIGRIVFPTVVEYPWPVDDSSSKKDKKRVVVLAGSYNPPHLGHLAMITYLSRRYGRVVVVVGMNPDKSYKVTPDQRAYMLRKMIRMDPAVNRNVRVEGKRTDFFIVLF